MKKTLIVAAIAATIGMTTAATAQWFGDDSDTRGYGRGDWSSYGDGYGTYDGRGRGRGTGRGRGRGTGDGEGSFDLYM